MGLAGVAHPRRIRRSLASPRQAPKYVLFMLYSTHYVMICSKCSILPSHSLLESAHSFSSVSISVFIGRFFFCLLYTSHRRSHKGDGVLAEGEGVTLLHLDALMSVHMEAELDVYKRQVQDEVERTLMERGHYEVAKAYILYREKRSALRRVRRCV